MVPKYSANIFSSVPGGRLQTYTEPFWGPLDIYPAIWWVLVAGEGLNEGLGTSRTAAAAAAAAAGAAPVRGPWRGEGQKEKVKWRRERIWGPR